MWMQMKSSSDLEWMKALRPLAEASGDLVEGKAAFISDGGMAPFVGETLSILPSSFQASGQWTLTLPRKR